MKRRKLIKNILMGIPGILLASPIVSCNKMGTNPKGKSVIIIGAGISGLAAARRLKEAGYSVTILESQEKSGGRIRTNRSLNFPFDEGASWIHGVVGNPLTEISNFANATLYQTVDEDRHCYDIGGNLVSSNIYDAAETKLYSILSSLMENGAPDTSFETVFNSQYPQYTNDRLSKFFLSTYVTFDTGALNKLSSLLYYQGEEFKGVEKIIVEGYDVLTEFLAKSIDIKLNERVSKIDYTQNKIKITSNGVVHESDFVIVTVPLGVLKKNSIQFVPDLPVYKTLAIEKVGMNCVNKFILFWENQFWDDVQYIAYTPEIKDKFNYFLNVKKIDTNTNALITYAYSDYAIQTETMTDAEIIEEIMIHLKDIYGSEIPYPTNMLRTKWGSNTNAYGAYSYTAVETEMQHFNDLAKSINSKVFFAGEHTEIDYFSTAHGAFLSGIREAKKIINTI